MIVEELGVIKEINDGKDQRKQIRPKGGIKDEPGLETIRSQLGRSPDFADSLMMRMYFEVAKNPEPSIGCGKSTAILIQQTSQVAAWADAESRNQGYGCCDDLKGVIAWCGMTPYNHHRKWLSGLSTKFSGVLCVAICV